MNGPRETELTQLIPCLHVFRAVGIAMEPRKLLLGMVGLCLLSGGFCLFELLPFAPDNAGNRLLYDDTPTEWLHSVRRESALDRVGRELWQPFDFAGGLMVQSSVMLLSAPGITLVEPASMLFKSGISVTEIAWNVTLLLWALMVWSIVGGALARMTAMQFARRERISIYQAVRFSTRQFLSYLIAPGLPLAGIGFLLCFNVAVSLIGSIPLAGGPVLALLWGLVLFISLLMAFMLAGIAVGWPLMIAAVSTEDSDGFDGLSRSFGFLLDRPWYALLLVATVLVAGLCGWFLLNVLMELTVYLATWSVAAGFQGPPGLQLPNHGSPDFQLVCAESAVEHVISGWMSLFAGLLAGFGPSYFFCAVTVIYLLLRKSDDGTALSEVAVYQESESDSGAADSAAAAENSDASDSEAQNGPDVASGSS